MLSTTKVASVITKTISEILGDAFDDDIEISESSLLTDIGLNSLMLARLILNLEVQFDRDPFSEGTYAIADIHTVGDLTVAYAGAGPSDA
jgi:acyl carrier protein